MNAIEIAKKMEEDAVKFYTEAASKTAHLVGKKMFLSIAKDEGRHLLMLDELLKGMEITASDVSPMKNMKTIFEELKDDMLEKAAASDDELNAFKIAMEMEKNGIDFYQKTVTEAQSDKEKKLFERLIKEEQQHYTIFSNTYTFLSDTGNWFLRDEQGIVEG